MNDLDRAKNAIKAGHSQDAAALALIAIAEALTTFLEGFPPQRHIINHQEEPFG